MSGSSDLSTFEVLTEHPAVQCVQAWGHAAAWRIRTAPPLVPKQQAGLSVLDRSGRSLAASTYPQRVYTASWPST